MKTSKKTNKYLKIFIIIFIIGVVVALIYFNNLKKDDLDIFIESIKSSNLLFKPINNITNHLKILSVITIFSVIFIGLPICTGLIISEGFDFTFRILLLYKIYKFKGALYGLIYYLIGNIIYIFLVYIIFKRVIVIFKKLYRYKLNTDSFNHGEIYNLLVKLIYIIIIIFISDIFIYLYAENILKLFAFLLK